MTLSRSCCYLDESAASFALSPCCFATRGILWSWLAERMALGIRRDTFLSLYGPLSLVMLIGSWVIGLMVGFALIQCSLSFTAEPVSFGANFLFSGDTFSLSEPPVSRRCPSCDNRSLYWRRAPVSHFWRS